MLDGVARTLSAQRQRRRFSARQRRSFSARADVADVADGAEGAGFNFSEFQVLAECVKRF